MKISVFFTILFFFFIAPIDIPFAEAKNEKQISSSEDPISYRSVSSGDINQQLNNYFTSLRKTVCENIKENEREKLLGFINHLNQLKQYILNLKRDFQLTLKDRELLNAILGRIQELPYEEIMKESKTVSEKASVMRSMFEHNYRYAYPEQISFAWWAQSIVESLSCLSEGYNSKVFKKPAHQRKPGKQD